MDYNLTGGLPVDSQQAKDIVAQVVGEVIKSLPKPKVPTWAEVVLDFIKVHPWVSLLLILSIFIIISVVAREVICAYLKTNDILLRLKRIEEKLKKD